MTTTTRVSPDVAASARCVRRGVAVLVATSAALVAVALPAQGRADSMTARPATNSSATANSPNWAGAVTTARRRGTFQGVAGNWRVPRVTGRGYSCTWVGVDGYGDKHLIQTGTEEDFYGGRAHYFAWYEILPREQTQRKIVYSSTNTLVPVRPGDRMFAYVMQSSAGIWRIHLEDKTRNWTFDQRFYYKTPERSAEWIQEGTMINNRYAAPAHFRPVTFTNMQVLENNTWYYTRLGNGSRLNQVLRGHLYATAGRPTRGTPQTVTIRYRG